MAYTPGVGPKPLNSLQPPRPPAATNLQAGNNFPGRTDASTGGYSPYYAPQDLTPYVNMQPGVMNAQLNLNNQGGLADDNLRQIIQQALIGYGDTSIASALLKQNPALAGSLSGAIDPQTANLAKANTAPNQFNPGGMFDGLDRNLGHSVLAQLQNQQGWGRDASLSALTAHGLQNSGEVGFEQQYQNRVNSQNSYNAGQTLLNQLSGANAQNLQTHTNLSDAYQNAVTRATSNVYAHPSAFPMPQAPGLTYVGQPPAAAPHPLPPLPRPTTPQNAFAAPSFSAHGGTA